MRRLPPYNTDPAAPSPDTQWSDIMSLSGLTPEQAKEFHEQFKITYTAFAGIAAAAHCWSSPGSPGSK
jgi:light-harvesting complex 1 beta chain